MPKVTKLKLFLSPPSMVMDLDTGHLRATNSFADMLAKKGSNMEPEIFVCEDL
ncbi:hypothetical protein Q3G72_031509 [Acer saccharum]|nr:hypothetical protein Q3G72_031509 [Acer saccharum]